MTDPRHLPDDPFEELTPPPGGLRALRHRLAGDRARRRRLRLATGAAALGLIAAAALLAVWLRAAPDGGARTAPRAAATFDHPGAVAYGLASAPAEPVVVHAADRMAATRIDTADDRVVYYRVASAPAPEPDTD